MLSPTILKPLMSMLESGGASGVEVRCVVVAGNAIYFELIVEAGVSKLWQVFSDQDSVAGEETDTGVDKREENEEYNHVHLLRAHPIVWKIVKYDNYIIHITMYATCILLLVSLQFLKVERVPEPENR